MTGKGQRNRWKKLRDAKRQEKHVAEMTPFQKELFDAFTVLDKVVQRIECKVPEAIKIANAMQGLARTLDGVMDGADDVAIKPKLAAVPPLEVDAPPGLSDEEKARLTVELQAIKAEQGVTNAN